MGANHTVRAAGVTIPGNHDEGARHFLGVAFGEIAIREDAIHTTIRGKRLWVTHGDRFDGVVCGHIHKAEIRDIGGVLYCNDGDWVESLTALVETVDGELRIVHWHELIVPKNEEATACAS